MKDRTAYICFVIIVIMMIFMGFFVDKCPAQEYFQWRWSDQKVLDMPDASGLHLIGSGYMAGSFDNTGKWWKSDLTALAIGVAWEVKDGLIPYERAGILGGEGFSWGDIQMNLTGIVTHRIGVLIWNRWKYHRWNLNKISK
ncbi:MAG: hypothetical protein WC440_00645 [Candidatus Omnitrophota bacterium]|jgi:hypothetical protein